VRNDFPGGEGVRALLGARCERSEHEKPSGFEGVMRGWCGSGMRGRGCGEGLSSGVIFRWLAVLKNRAGTPAAPGLLKKFAQIAIDLIEA